MRQPANIMNQGEYDSTAVIYARFSSHNQTEQSIEGQLRVCYEYAERSGYKVVGEYIDRALTGRSDDRPDFQRMILDSRKKAFQYVIVYKLDRFARNRYDSAIYKHKLKLNGVKVLSAMENIGDNPESIILEAVLEASAEYYSVDLSQKIKRGSRESALKGQFLGGQVPFGYKVVDHQLVINEVKAPIIFLLNTQKGPQKKILLLKLTLLDLEIIMVSHLEAHHFSQHYSVKSILALCAGTTLQVNALPLLIKELFTRYKSEWHSINVSLESKKQK